MNRSTVTCWMTALLAVLGTGSPAAAYDWEITRLDEREGFMHSESLAVGPDGTIYVSYVLVPNPPSDAGEVYVARRNDGVWTRTLVSDSFVGYGTAIAVNPVTQQPGVVFQAAGGYAGRHVGFWEFDGVEWVEQDVPQSPLRSVYCLAYTSNGEAYVAYGITTTVAGETIYFSRVIRRTTDGWEDVPIPVQGDWLNLAGNGANVIAAGTSATRGQPGLRWLDVMQFLPNDLSAATVDQLPAEAVDGNVSVRTPGLAIDRDGHILASYCMAYSMDTEDFAEVKLARYDETGWNEPEVLLGGGSIADPTAYSLALQFYQYTTVTVTDERVPFVFGVSQDYAALNVAMPRPEGWTVYTIDTAGSCSGLWRGHGAGIDPETNAPIVAYAKGAQHQVDTVVHVARLIPPSGDSDTDGDVDLSDFGAFADCQGGPDQSPNEAPTVDECLRVFDFDLDGDVDLHDFASFQEEFTGV